ncbi:MAG: hypothetical protein Q8L48_19385 [Archangium sp.]|nr:hypothetical protein [Archangium sp.]
MRRLFFLLLLLAVTGCRHRFPLPYPTHQLVKDSAKWPGDALVHYLTQPNADVSVCTLAAPHTLRRTDEELVEPFVTSLEERRLTPERWQACATRLVPALSPSAREFTFGRLARVILSLLDTDDSAPRLIAAHEVLATRPQEPSASLEALMGRLKEYPRERLKPPLPPVFDALVATLELDHGQLAGRPLTGADVVNTQDEALLGRMALRLPDPRLRGSARSRLIRLRIERSEFPEVKARAAEVEAAVMERGRWAQPVASLKLERPELPLPLPFVAQVRQHVDAQVVTLLAPGTGADQLVPVLDLKGVVRFAVGWSRPLSLCQPASALAVDPCIDARELEVGNPMVSVDGDGVLRLPEKLAMAQAMELARADEGLVLPIRLGGRLVTSLQVPLRFEAPDSIYFEGNEGERGPNVNVAVQPVASALLFSAVSDLGVQRMAILPRGVGTSFEVASLGGRGLAGRDGYNGSDGTRGSDGASASCFKMQPGQPGGQGGPGDRGGDGGQGGRGGDGGFVSVVVQCGGACPADELLVRQRVHSRGGEGGAGGDGGRGGRGGDGGSGGSGTTCTVNGHNEFLSSGTSGPRGSDGNSGHAGMQGSEGQAGPVQVQVQ